MHTPYEGQLHAEGAGIAGTTVQLWMKANKVCLEHTVEYADSLTAMGGWMSRVERYQLASCLMIACGIKAAEPEGGRKGYTAIGASAQVQIDDVCIRPGRHAFVASSHVRAGRKEVFEVRTILFRLLLRRSLRVASNTRTNRGASEGILHAICRLQNSFQ